jgi:hypothetical protein
MRVALDAKAHQSLKSFKEEFGLSTLQDSINQCCMQTAESISKGLKSKAQRYELGHFRDQKNLNLPKSSRCFSDSSNCHFKFQSQESPLALQSEHESQCRCLKPCKGSGASGLL